MRCAANRAKGRRGHQRHHSPTRVGIPGSVFFIPLEMLVQVALRPKLQRRPS
jgi:hypothetical protein